MKSAFQTCDQRRVHLIALVLECICNEISDFIYMYSFFNQGFFLY